MNHPDWCEEHRAYDCAKPEMRQFYPGDCEKQRGGQMTTYYGPAALAHEMDRPYYCRGGIEAIDVTEAWELGYNLGSVLKYIARCGQKTPDRLEDLKKARWYLDREIWRLQQTASAPPPPAAMQAQLHAQAQVTAARQFSNVGMDAARRQMQGSDFSFGQSVEPARLVPRQICPADDVTKGEEAGTFISRPPVSNA